MTSVLYTFIKALVAKTTRNHDEIQGYLDELYLNKVDTTELLEQAKNECPVCSSAQDNLADIEACQIALRLNTDDGWQDYKEQFPSGGCSRQ